jgi:L-iditol 2-dehydrogenase
MKALVLERYSEFSYDDVPVPEVDADEVLVRVKACGICGSDVHGMDGSTGRRRPPIIMGHEAAGVIAGVGAQVTGWAEGDRVTFDSTISCGGCRFCVQGLVNLCDNRRVFGVSCDEYSRSGAFAEYVTVPARILYRLPDDLSFEHAALVETVSIAVHAVNRARLKPGETAVVIGTGMVGLLVVQALRAYGCERVLGVDVDPVRLELAARFGAETIQSGIHVAEELHARTGGGTDAAIEVVGVTSALDAAVQSLRRGGRVVLVGNKSPQVDLSLQAVVTRELTIYGSCASAGEYPASLELMASGRVDVEPLISAVASLEDGAEWFERLHAGEPGLMKVILEP